MKHRNSKFNYTQDKNIRKEIRMLLKFLIMFYAFVIFINDIKINEFFILTLSLFQMIIPYLISIFPLILFFYFFQFKLPWSKIGHSIQLNPITWKWKMNIWVKVDQTQGYEDKKITRWLLNTKNVNLTYFFSTFQGKKSFFVMFTFSSWLIPYRTRHLESTVGYIFNLCNVNFTYVKQPKFPRYSRGVDFHNSPVSLCELNLHIEKVIEAQENSICYEVNFKSKKKQITYSFKVLYNSKHDKDISLLSLQSVAQNVKISKRTRSFTLHPNLISPLVEIPKLFGSLSSATLNFQSANHQIPLNRNLLKSDVYLGNYLRQLTDTQKREIYCPLEDFNQGGVISGSIGSGKTNLRLSIMKQMIISGIKIIDFDLKGDAFKIPFFQNSGVLFTPKVNLSINLFEIPPTTSKEEHIDFLFQLFITTLSDGDLSSIQKEILFDALQFTVTNDGDISVFFQNILKVGITKERLVTNNQNNSSISLISKLKWLQTSFKDIFWSSSSNFTPDLIRNNNVFFDFSLIAQRSPLKYVRFLIDVIVNLLVLSYSRFDLNKTNKFNLNHVLFLDESQHLFPSSKVSDDFSKLEETVLTLRYKGISVIATGTSVESFSSVMKNVGFFVQFRTDDKFIGSILGLTNDQSTILPTLPNFHAVAKFKSFGFSPVLMRTSVTKFDNRYSLNSPSIEFDKMELLPEFKVSNKVLSHIYFESLIPAQGTELFRSNLVEKLALQNIFQDFIDFYSPAPNIIDVQILSKLPEKILKFYSEKRYIAQFNLKRLKFISLFIIFNLFVIIDLQGISKSLGVNEYKIFNFDKGNKFVSNIITIFQILDKSVISDLVSSPVVDV